MHLEGSKMDEVDNALYDSKEKLTPARDLFMYTALTARFFVKHMGFAICICDTKCSSRAKGRVKMHITMMIKCIHAIQMHSFS